jgi:NADH-quinone oxidoreductase subunit M
VVVVISAWEVITERVNQYMGAFLILSGFMIGVFAALDGILFYVFFEATLIPMYLIIGIWGGPNKIYAAFKFFLYTLLGSLLMLVALIYLYNKSGGSFDILTWHKLPLGSTAQTSCSSRSLPPLPSRCRCGRFTPGCPTCTSRRRPAARPCWRPSC